MAMASEEDFMLYDIETCARSEAIRHDGRSHSDDAESSKPYSAEDGRDEYSEEQNFCGGHKGLEAIHGGKGFQDQLDGRVMTIESQHFMAGMNGGHLQRRGDRCDAETSKSMGSIGKRKDRDETSDGGTYVRKGKGNGGDGYKKDREEWSDGAISCLLDVYTEKYLQLNKGNLRGSDWEEVAAIVSERGGRQKPGKTVDQCKNKVDSLKKRYKTEKNRGLSNGITSYWPWFRKVDQIVGMGPKLTVLSDDEKERGVRNPVMIKTKRLQTLTPSTPGFISVPKKSSSRWRRVLLKISGDALAGDHTQNIDPKIVMSIAREVASATRLGVEVAIMVGGGNFFNGASWVGIGGLDHTSADHIGMMATVMNSIFLQASLESAGVPTRVQTALTMSMPEITEPYTRRKAIRHLEKGRVVIFGAGTGNPYCTTDAAAAIRAAEINAEVVLKATSVDGVYDCDPKLNPDAILLERLSYRDMATKDTTVMDITAVTLCQENGIPVVIFNLNETGNITRALNGEQVGTLIDQTGDIYPHP